MAGIARIGLIGGESEKFSGEIVKLFELLNTMNDAPECDSFCFDPIGISDALRDDVPIVDDNVEAMLKDMSTHDGYVRGPRIV
ncbi:MAG: hypothetical protein FWH44_03800 [Methanomassiliicoccaceae archaeon]|nr:hypothetical protein [Methanomassiliicoccaceae archaeon]